MKNYPLIFLSRNQHKIGNFTSLFGELLIAVNWGKDTGKGIHWQRPSAESGPFIRHRLWADTAPSAHFYISHGTLSICAKGFFAILAQTQHIFNCFKDIHLNSSSASTWAIFSRQRIYSVMLRATHLHTYSSCNSVRNASWSQIWMKYIASIILTKGNLFFYTTHVTFKI